jgi:hypothetical protein
MVASALRPSADAVICIAEPPACAQAVDGDQIRGHPSVASGCTAARAGGESATLAIAAFSVEREADVCRSSAVQDVAGLRIDERLSFAEFSSPRRARASWRHPGAPITAHSEYSNLAARGPTPVAPDHAIPPR